MSLLGLGLVGVMVGIAGSELIRASMPEFVRRIEETAKRFVVRVGFLESNENEPTDQ